MVDASENGRFWWEQRWFICFLLLLSVLPLLWPTFPPLNDLTGHMGRYRVQLDLASDPGLQQFYDFKWSLILNLGADVLMEVFGPIFGVELATKLIVILTMLVTVSGLLWMAKEIHGRIPPTAMLSIPFLYGHVTSFGFLNYMLSMGLAFNLFALWLYFDRTGRHYLRTWVMIPASFILAIVHIYGWGVLGLLIFGFEFNKQRESGAPLVSGLFQAGIRCLPLAGPALMLLFWRTGPVESTKENVWFDVFWKYYWVMMSLRDRWDLFDRISILIVCIIVLRVAFAKTLGFARQLHVGMQLLAAAFVIIPFSLLSSAYADMRLASFLFMIAMVSILWPKNMTRQQVGWIGLAALSFCFIRISSNVASYALYDREMKRELAALDHIPKHARLFSMVEFDCEFTWFEARKEHLPSLALVRNRAYANDQWAAAGAQLIRSKIDAPDYAIDGSQFASKRHCLSYRNTEINHRMQNIPRDAFDYVWLIEVPPYDEKSLSGMTQIWKDGQSAVYRIDHKGVAARPPARP